MDYVKKFLNVEGVIGQGAFGRVLVTSTLQNVIQPAQQPQQQESLQHLEPKQNLRQLRYSLDSSGSQLQRQSATNVSVSPHSSIASQQESEKDPQDGQLLRQSPSSDQVPARRFALKCVHPILKPQRLANELRHLRDLGGSHNVVRMHTAHLFKGSLYIVMELFEHDRFIEIVAQLEYEEIVMYMENLLEALEHVHSRNIMHRDIKPANFLFNRKYRKFLLIDFGLAQSVTSRAVLFFNRPASTATTPIANINMPLSSAPTTPTSLPSRRLMTPLTPDFYNKRKDTPTKLSNNIGVHPLTNMPLINTIQSPSTRLFNLTPTVSPNVGTKRHLTEVSNTNVNQMLKKLRVSNEPVKLTVGAYESPITNGDGSTKRTNYTKNHTFSTPTVPKRNLYIKCDCSGKPKTCTNCQTKSDSAAPKSGTPGYKAPEILLRSPNQTTAVDIWSAGVIFACLLSGHTPFFRDAEDTAALAEIITLLGTQRVAQAAEAMSIRLLAEPKREPVDLKQLCKKIRLNNKDKRQMDIPDDAFDLLNRMLDPYPGTRITAREALREHSWLKSRNSSGTDNNEVNDQSKMCIN